MENQSKKTKKTSSEQQINELISDLQRTRADFENFRKQVELQKAQVASFTKYSTVLKILPIIDDLDRAITSYPELVPLQKTLDKTLESLGLEKIESSQNTPFDPNFHEAVLFEEDSEGEKEVISETMRSGYTYEKEVIRPAMVKVKRISTH